MSAQVIIDHHSTSVPLLSSPTEPLPVASFNSNDYDEPYMSPTTDSEDEPVHAAIRRLEERDLAAVQPSVVNATEVS